MPWSWSAEFVQGVVSEADGYLPLSTCLSLFLKVQVGTVNRIDEVCRSLMLQCPCSGAVLLRTGEAVVPARSLGSLLCAVPEAHLSGILRVFSLFIQHVL